MIQLPLRYRIVLIAVCSIGVSMIINPAIVNPPWIYDPVGDGILTAEGLLGLLAIAAACAWKIWADLNAAAAGTNDERPATETQNDRTPPGRATSWRRGLPIAFAILAAWLVLFRHRILHPTLGPDDEQYLAIAASWSTTFDNLFTPYNEHLCVLTRLYTRLIVACVAPDKLVAALAIGGMMLFAAASLALFVFMRLECGAESLAYIAVSLFALTRVHDEVVQWYAASQWCWSLLILLVCLIVVRPARARARRSRIAIGGLLASLAPLNFAVGLFVGPIAALYLVTQRARRVSDLNWWWCFVPLLGTVVCLAAIVPLKSREIIDRADYGGRSPSDAVSILGGSLHATRSTVDLLVLRNLGFETAGRRPRIVYAVLFPLLIFAAVELVLWTRSTALPGVGCGTILVAYAITLPFRAWVPYEDFVHWTRYQLFPHLGVVFLLTGALAMFGPRWLCTSRLNRRQTLVIAALIAIQLAVHGFIRA